MEYEDWRQELFAHRAVDDAKSLKRGSDFYTLPPHRAFDYIDRVLVDPAAHAMFSKDQLGSGLQTIYLNYCSDLPYLYTSECDEPRRLAGIHNLVHLYSNYFERYCTAPVTSIDGDQSDGPMGFLCYMLWELFVLYADNATPSMRAAAIHVMQMAVRSSNDNCVVSAIHGLGHWSLAAPDALAVLTRWLRRPTTRNAVVLRYAELATRGAIL